MPIMDPATPSRLVRLATHFLLLTFLAIALFFISSIAYPIIYNRYIPPLQVTHAVHLDFLSPHYAHPAYSSQLTPPLPADQLYAPTLTLIVPRSPTNVAKANFMASLALFSPSNATLARFSRPGIVPYASPLLATIKTLISSPLLVTGLWREEDTVSVPFPTLRSPQEIAGFNVQLERGVAVYSARLDMEAVLEGTRWWVWKGGWFLGVVGVGVFWAFTLAGLVVGWWLVSGVLVVREARIKREQERESGEEEGEEEEGEEEEGEEEEGGEGEGETGLLTPPRVESSDDAEKADEDTSEEERSKAVDMERDSGLGSLSEGAGASTGRERSLEARRRSRAG